jgi:hypothetical protein
MTDRWNRDESLQAMPLAELCDQLLGKYSTAQYGAFPLRVEAARRLERLQAEIERLNKVIADIAAVYEPQ